MRSTDPSRNNCVESFAHTVISSKGLRTGNILWLLFFSCVQVSCFSFCISQPGLDLLLKNLFYSDKLLIPHCKLLLDWHIDIDAPFARFLVEVLTATIVLLLMRMGRGYILNKVN